MPSVRRSESDEDVRPVSRLLELRRGDRVLIFVPVPQPAGGWPTRAAAALTDAGIHVAKIAPGRRSVHQWLRADEKRPKLVIAGGDVLVAAEAAAEYDVPLLAITPGYDSAVVVEQLEKRHFRLRTETLLRVQPTGRTARSVLAECVVMPNEGEGVLRVRGEDELDAIVPSLRIVSRDPFFLVGDGRCAHQSPSRVGLCWTGDQPIADRMVARNARLTITPHSGAHTLAVDCDEGRFRAVTEKLFVGPACRIEVASAIPDSARD